MSETIQNNIQHDVAAQIEKARKPGKKKAAKKPAPKASSNGVSPQRAQLIKTMRKSGGTLADLTRKSGLPERAVYHHLWHMRKDGFVKTETLDHDGKDELKFDLSARGKKIAV